MRYISETLQTLNNQIHQPDAIYLNIPLRHSRSNQTYKLPKDMSAILAKFPSTVVQRPERDWGPLTKLLPTLEAEEDGETIIITVDDDKLYPNNLVSTLVSFMERQQVMGATGGSSAGLGDTAFGSCGWAVQPWPRNDAPCFGQFCLFGAHGWFWWPRRGLIEVYVPYYMRSDAFPRYVDVLQVSSRYAAGSRFFSTAVFCPSVVLHCGFSRSPRLSVVMHIVVISSTCRRFRSPPQFVTPSTTYGLHHTLLFEVYTGR
jgi:hypothetical protein